MSTAQDAVTDPPVPRVLSIAGTDPTGGAGVQADLKSIAAQGGYGMAVVTALVAQNTHGVRAVHTPPTAFLRAQLDAVADDVEVDAVKTGMLGDAATVAAVEEWLLRIAPPVVVVDPVMVATSGDRLLRADAERALVAMLGALGGAGGSDVLVTPNVPELGVLADAPPARSWDELLAQARAVAAATGVTVLAKGGHLEGPDADDILVAPGSAGGPACPVVLAGRRVATTCTHGTGCSLSSAVATARVRYGSWEPAAREAKRWLTESLAAAESLRVGTGRGPISHLAGLWERGGLETRLRPAGATGAAGA
ncbi:MAG: bifunctional hydroxymethylpyrimidine kinase/phosphomethylpyrimidine kinase [Nocardioides sp.]|nr:bifunctional hydroxymethylpyrimidine kinase/phosphomethylpyrimidine kinase [Nocardioides sp.]